MSAAPSRPQGHSAGKPQPDFKPVPRWSASRSLLLGLLLLPVALAALRAGAGQVVAIVYGTASLLTFIGYWEDKRRARKDLRRIPESSLHLGELLGGWPGAFVARSLFRHKTQKRCFRLVYALIVTSHLYVACDTLLGWRIRDLVINGFASLFS